MAEVIRENGSYFNKSKEFSSRSQAIEEVSVHTILVLKSHLLHVNDEAGSNSVNEEVAN